ncbi:MAG: hypothetical protein JWO98_5333 [Frankiales bacterium]|nr:hypothetical protein [Frankiales bacterium]
MSVTTTNLIQGPASLFIGAFGATEPTFATPAIPVGFVDLGATNGGCKLTIKQTYSDKDVDQIADIPGTTLKSRETSLATSLAEATLANLAIALNELAASVTSGTFTPGTGQPNEPNFSSVLMKGLAPNGKTRLVILRRALNTASTESEWKKDGQTLIPVEFAGYYVSDTIRPFTVIDLP